VTFNPDDIVFWQWGALRLNATLVFTWVVMAVLLLVARLATRHLSDDVHMSRWQNLLETLVGAVNEQVREIARREPGPYLPFIGTLFLFIALANFLAVVPGYWPPTASLSTTVALAICVFVAVPLFGISQQGWRAYLGQYLKPSALMLPFNIIGEVSRTFALAVRLYGNIMSGTVIVAVLLGLAPLLFPVIMQAFGVLIGIIQAYIFAVLAMVYIAAASASHRAAGAPPGNDPGYEPKNEESHHG
jgi:F-type H+-transporting ATPase subunit a